MRSRHVAAVAAGLTVLAGTAAATVGPALAGAIPTVVDDTTPEDSTTDEPGVSADSDAATSGDAETGAADGIAAILEPLVEDGTITRAQADAVGAALANELPFGGPRGGRLRLGVSLDTLTDVLGVTRDELHAAFGEGQSIADVADAQGVDPQEVVDALLVPITERLDEAVADGRLSAEEADERTAELTERITAFVEEPGGARFGDRFRLIGPGGPGLFHPGLDVDAPFAGDDETAAPAEPGTTASSVPPESSVPTAQA